MARTLAIAAIVVLCVAGAAGTLLFLAYGVSDQPPRTVDVSRLNDSTSVTVYENGSASIRARSREDAYAALGFLHAAEHGWTMTLWQRAARGRLAEWLGEALLPIDRLTRRLGLAAFAEAAYLELPSEERSILDAYARGANAALLHTPAGQAREFSALALTPDPWQPWFSLSIDRLFAWMSATVPDEDRLHGAPRDLRSFLDAGDRLKRLLHVHGFDAGLAWTLRNTAESVLAQRHVTGASAAPVFQPVELTFPTTESVAGATLIGTPFMPAGRNARYAWAVLLSGAADVTASTRDSSTFPLQFERLTTAAGDEYVLRFRREAGGLYFKPDRSYAPGVDADSALTPVRADDKGQTGWVVRWRGMDSVEDATAWMRLQEDGPVAFQIYDGDGLIMHRDGSADVLGTPQFVYEHDRGVSVGNNAWTRYAVERIDSISTSRAAQQRTPAYFDDVHSTWASERAPGLVEEAAAAEAPIPLVREALTYLRNWDYSYDRASIAASIFDAWTIALRSTQAHSTQPHSTQPGSTPRDSTPPDSIPPYSLAAERTAPAPVAPMPGESGDSSDFLMEKDFGSSSPLRPVAYEALEDAVLRLASEYGSDPSQWRWEQTQPHRYHFPLWSSDASLAVEIEPLASTRYAPFILQGLGHETTLYHGPSRIDGVPESPARFEAWTSTARWDAFNYRSRRFPVHRILGRYLVSDHIPDPAAVPAGDRVAYTTTLLPD